MNRYYSTGYGRFLTVDPFGGSAEPENPMSWNRYGYGSGDPVNRADPSGLDDGDGGDDFADPPYSCNLFNGCMPPCLALGGSLLDQSFYSASNLMVPGINEAYCVFLPVLPILPFAQSGGHGGSATKCKITVVGKGAPRNQNLVQIMNDNGADYAPLTNTLGKYANSLGLFFAVQIQATLFGDANPSDWAASQTASNLGTFSVPGSGPIQHLVASHADSPEPWAVDQATPGSFDWLDVPGEATHYNGDIPVIGMDQTRSFTSTLTNIKTHQSCSVTWSVRFTLTNSGWNAVLSVKGGFLPK
jgi:hypothetical protein